MSAHKDLAKRILRHMDRRANGVRQQQQIGQVTRLRPLTINPMDLDYTLDEDEVVLSQWVKQYNRDHRIDVGDNVMMHFANGHWIVVDVLSDKEI
jgi:hypothetical protein